MSLRKIIKQIVQQERSQQVQFQPGISTSIGRSYQGVKVKGRAYGYNATASIAGEPNARDENLIVMQLNGSPHLPVILGKGAYMYPYDPS